MGSSEKSLQFQLDEGKITNDIRMHLEKELVNLEQYKPNSWDAGFIRSMITYKETLTLLQKFHLRRICQILEDDSISIEI